ncbi:hypothetical protein [Amorphus sp. 3PC139-8]|uniref:hypothetical protein n=1 Tax=Amorphus sp. 3PC139-8 TaxID=2735676 RepID=UPI00345D5F0E
MRMEMAGIAIAVAFGLASSVASANTLYEIDQIRKATPSCNANPNAQWVGRVSGSVEDDTTDQIIPVSFVGCFTSEAECNRWKEKTSGFITGPIIQYTCNRRS